MQNFNNQVLTKVAEPLQRCILTGLHVQRNDLEYAGFHYWVEAGGVLREIKLASYDYENDCWFRTNRHRIARKVERLNHWDYLAQGMSFAELQDYLVAPANVL